LKDLLSAFAARMIRLSSLTATSFWFQLSERSRASAKVIESWSDTVWKTVQSSW